MNETWYILEDNSACHPRDIKPGKDGLLAHKDGRKVAYGAHGPRSRSVDPQEEVNRVKKPAPVVETKLPDKTTTEDMQPAPKPAAAARPGYKTRDK